MAAKTDVFVKRLTWRISKWDDAFDQFQIKEYPARLTAQALYRKQVEDLKEKRRLIEERLLNFKNRMKWPRA